jgi:hypothetical protein
MYETILLDSFSPHHEKNVAKYSGVIEFIKT